MSERQFADVTINGEEYYPHYFSTYCIHGLHDRCRVTCKHCERYCRCACHQPGTKLYFDMLPPTAHNDD